MATAMFLALTAFVVVIPAINNQNNNAPLPGTVSLMGDALAGKHVFIANGCVACHSQQVRNIEMDKVWGSRPSIAADYSNNRRMSWWMNTATLMGTERTGPDLTNIGNRLPSVDWHLLHLYNPRAVVNESIMPAYPWLFTVKEKLDSGDKEINLPDEFKPKRNGHVVATNEALQLVAYLQSLKQVPLPDGTATPEFLARREQQVPADTPSGSPAGGPAAMDGAALYQSNCQACHQANGEGLKGAFPPLKASAVVLDENPEVLIDIIMNGYDAREEYAEMPAVGQMNGLTPEEITAIINHERSSWGNQAKKVSVEEVEKVVAFVTAKKTNQ